MITILYNIGMTLLTVVVALGGAFLLIYGGMCLAGPDDKCDNPDCDNVAFSTMRMSVNGGKEYTANVCSECQMYVYDYNGDQGFTVKKRKK